MEKPYVPFYKPYGMTDEEYEYEVRIAEQQLSEWEAEQEALQQADVSGNCFDNDIWNWRYEIQYRLDQLKALGQLDNKQHPYNLQIENRRRYIRDKLKLKYNYR